MTGNIGEKARAAFLALIMVTSVMMAGVAFSGSAAALEDPSVEDGFGQLAITSGPAEDSNTDANLVATTVVDGPLTNDEDLQAVNLTIDSEDSDVLTPSGVSNANIQVEIIDSSGSVDNTLDASDPNINPTQDDGTTTIGLEGIENSSVGDADDIPIEQGDKIRLSIQGTNVDVSKASGSIDASLNVGVADSQGSANFGASESVDLSAATNPGPVQIEGGNSYSTISQAISNAGADDTIIVDDGQYDGQGSTLKVKDTNGLTIQAASGASPEVIVDAEAGESLKESQLFVQDSENVTVDGVNFVGNYNSTRDIVGAADNREGRQIQFENAANATLQNVKITNDVTDTGDNNLQHIIYASGSPDLTINSSSTVNVTTGSSATLDRSIIQLDADRSTVTNSEIIENRDSPGENAIQVGTSGAEKGATITNNTITAGTAVRVGQDDAEVSGNTFNTESTGMTIDDDFSSADGLLVENNEFNHTSTNDDTAIPIDGNDNIDITDNTIEGYGAGVTIGDGDNNNVGSVNITGGEILNSTGEAIEVTDNSDFSSSEITVDGVTI